MRIEYRVTEELLQQIQSRVGMGSGTSLIARRDLERYYQALPDEMRDIQLSQDEMSLLRDALNGVLHEPHTYRLLWAGVDDAIRHEGLAEKWHVDGEALVTRLRDMTPGQTMAIIDAVERYWLNPQSI